MKKNKLSLEEVWKPLRDYPGYEISSQKRIKKLAREKDNRSFNEKILSSYKHDGNDYVNIRRANGNRTTISVELHYQKNFNINPFSYMIDIKGSPILSLIEELIILNKEEMNGVNTEFEYKSYHTTLISMIEDEMLDLNL